MRRLMLLTLMLAGCGDSSLKVLRNPPAVVINSPEDDQQYPNGDVVEFVGRVADDSPVDELDVEWVSSIDGVLPDTDPPDPDGLVEFATASMSEGVHVVTLRAIDPTGEQAEDSVTVEILDVPDLPSIVVTHPTPGEKGLEDSAFVFSAVVDDYQDPPENLSLELASTPGGPMCSMIIDGDGNSQCPYILPIGEYMLTFTVTDSDGNQAQALATYEVVSPADYDFDGDGYSENGGDCNDSEDTIYPGAPEVCDGLDNDCNEATGIDVGSECYDDDGDGYCEQPPCINTSQTLSDCDDTSTSISPEGIEVLNGVDDDCDGFIDEGTAVFDDDGDGFCESPPCVNASGTESDCDDGDYAVYPGATEVCADGVDNNCDGLTNEQNAIGCLDFYYDSDGDTYGVSGATQCWCDDGDYPYTGIDATDCYDSNPNANPGNTAYYTVDRGDGSYDYDCSGSPEKQYTSTTGGCGWGVITYTSCDVDGAGWDGPVPACGQNGQYVNDCSGSYDVACYALCVAFSSDILGCVLSCATDCNPNYSGIAQPCR